MKRLLFLLLIGLPLFANAENSNDNINSKYLEGAINLVEGKVTFNESIELPGWSAMDIYNNILSWAEKRFRPQKDYWTKLAYKNEDKKEMAIVGNEYIVFKSNALALDRTRIYYQLRIYAHEGKCDLSMTNIRYWYEENRDGGEKYAAEEWITDDMALNKSKTKLTPITGKFRRKTIDLKDEIFLSAREALAANKTIRTHVQISTTQNPATEDISATGDGEWKTVAITALPTHVNKTISQSRITIKANGEEVQIESTNWGGMGKMLNKDVAYIIVDPNRIVTNAILNNSEKFCITVYAKKSGKEMINIECKKAMLQKMTAEDLKSFNHSLAGDKEYNVYISEIKEVKMR